ncbi:MAG: metallophosphatase family protein, partial [Acidobacteriota bacterium]|nr:metallophosphatase family protein [Acidobacteriota bacterium]
ANALPATAVTNAGAVKIYVLHDLHQLDIDPVKSGFSIVVSGHSHKPVQENRDGVLYINPGSAGPRRFRLPVSAARLDLDRPPWKVEFVDLQAH